MEIAARLDGVSFFYPRREIEVEDDVVRAVENPDEVTRIFNRVSVDLPAAMMSVVGQNGIGKSTLLLLVGGRLFPHEGSVTVYGVDTKSFVDAASDPSVEEQRNRLVSFVYQNMEFETQESVGDLMEFVHENGFSDDPDPSLLGEIKATLEMEPFLHLKTQQLSKGQLQRAIIAFSLLYGSRMIIMDEPVFALEEAQKDRAFGFLREFSRGRRVPIYYSVHNLDLSEKYSDYLLLFSKTGDFVVGPTEMLFTRERIEEAFQAPIDTLHSRDLLYRETVLMGRGTEAT